MLSCIAKFISDIVKDIFGGCAQSASDYVPMFRLSDWPKEPIRPLVVLNGRPCRSHSLEITDDWVVPRFRLVTSGDHQELNGRAVEVTKYPRPSGRSVITIATTEEFCLVKETIRTPRRSRKLRRLAQH